MMISQAGIEGPVITLEMSFRAPRAKIWQAWTDPELLRKWHLADEGFRCLRAEVDLRPHGPFLIEIEDPSSRDKFSVRGHYVDIATEEELVYTWAAMSDPTYWTLVTARFSDGEGGKGSRLGLQHGIFRSEEDRVVHEQGWAGCLSQLGVLLGEPVES